MPTLYHSVDCNKTAQVLNWVCTVCLDLSVRIFNPKRQHELNMFYYLTEFLQPYKPRPETSAVAARRLVVGALGLQSRVPKEKRDKERQQLKEAKG